MLNLAPTTWVPNSGQCIVGMQSATRSANPSKGKSVYFSSFSKLMVGREFMGNHGPLNFHHLVQEEHDNDNATHIVYIYVICILYMIDIR